MKRGSHGGTGALGHWGKKESRRVKSLFEFRNGLRRDGLLNDGFFVVSRQTINFFFIR